MELDGLVLEVTLMPALLRSVALTVLLTASAPSLAATATPSLVAASIDDLFSRLTAYGFSGSVLVVQRGETLLRKGYGLTDQRTGTPVEPETAFDIGSITKQFTASAILRPGDGRQARYDGPARKLSTGHREARRARAGAGPDPRRGGRNLPPSAPLAYVRPRQLLSRSVGVVEGVSGEDSGSAPARASGQRFQLLEYWIRPAGNDRRGRLGCLV